MRGATQTRKRRVGPRLEFWRGIGRLATGKTFTFGEDHEGYYTNFQHAVLNWLPVFWLAFCVWLMTVRLELAKWWVLGSLAIGAFLIVGYLYRCVEYWWRFRGLYDPLAKTVGTLIGWPRSTRSWKWLHFPRKWESTPDATARIDLKYESANSEDKREDLLEAVEASLGKKLDARYTEWHLDVRPSLNPLQSTWPYLLLRPESPPPDIAMFADHRKRVEAYRKDSQIAVGIGCFDQTEMVDIDHDAPHAVIAADSGRGKSSIEALVGCQMCHKGAVSVIIDPKIVSLQAFKGLPNVAYFAGEEASHHGLLALKAEMKRRAEVIDVPWGVRPPNPGPRLMVLIEEADSLVAELRDWMEDMGKGRSNIRSITAMSRLRNMGRELRIHIFIVTQTAGAAALGGNGSQTGFGLQLISANHEGIFKKLSPQVKEIPAQSPHLGRWHMNRPGSGDTPVEVQAFGFPKPKAGEEHLKFAEAREYAVSGTVGVIPELLQEALDLVKGLKEVPSAPLSQANYYTSVVAPRGAAVPQDDEAAPHARHLTVVPPGVPESLTARIALGYYNEPATEPVEAWITLRQAVEDHHLWPTVKAAQVASQRKGFPPEHPDEHRPTSFGPAKLYRRSDLEEYGGGKRWTLEGANRA